MPESKKRRREYSAPSAGRPVKRRKPSPVWLAPLMLALFGIGILWLVVFYLTSGQMGGFANLDALGNGNLLVGFGFIVSGFVMSTQWR